MVHPSIQAWLRCFTGPALYRIYPQSGNVGRPYLPNALERHADTVNHLVVLCANCLLWLSPILLIYYYRRDALTMETAVRLGYFFGIAGVGSWLCRGVGRLANQDYTMFARVYNKAMHDVNSPISQQLLHRYDFSFWAWPVDYKWRSEEQLQNRPASRMLDVNPPPVTDWDSAREGDRPSAPPSWARRQFQVGLDFVAAHTIGRRMLYPGSLGIMKALLRFALDQGRAKLAEEHQARRFKLQTASNRSIETAFVDKRRQTANGHTLVVCCEGNGGYLEIGVMATPLEKGYSALGWNHPGFGGSEGVPWPDQEREAIEVVVQFAFEELGFEPKNVVLSGWSIGGFTATWAARRYPQVGGLFLDATFDDVVPLALARMPRSWDRLVRHTLRKYLNLPIAKQLQSYDGPVKFVRRRRDEVISTSMGSTPWEQQSTNRGNDLLVDFLSHRYPHLIPQNVGVILEWLHADDDVRLVLLTQLTNSDRQIPSWKEYLRRFVDSEKNTSLDNLDRNKSEVAAGHQHKFFPCLVGRGLNATLQRQLTLFLASWYMDDFDHTHCTPLEARFFDTPTHPWENEDSHASVGK